VAAARFAVQSRKISRALLTKAQKKIQAAYKKPDGTFATQKEILAQAPEIQALLDQEEEVYPRILEANGLAPDPKTRTLSEADTGMRLVSSWAKQAGTEIAPILGQITTGNWTLRNDERLKTQREFNVLLNWAQIKLQLDGLYEQEQKRILAGYEILLGEIRNFERNMPRDLNGFDRMEIKRFEEDLADLFRIREELGREPKIIVFPEEFLRVLGGPDSEMYPLAQENINGPIRRAWHKLRERTGDRVKQSVEKNLDKLIPFEPSRVLDRILAQLALIQIRIDTELAALDTSDRAAIEAKAAELILRFKIEQKNFQEFSRGIRLPPYFTELIGRDQAIALEKKLNYGTVLGRLGPLNTFDATKEAVSKKLKHIQSQLAPWEQAPSPKRAAEARERERRKTEQERVDEQEHALLSAIEKERIRRTELLSQGLASIKTAAYETLGLHKQWPENPNPAGHYNPDAVQSISDKIGELESQMRAVSADIKPVEDNLYRNEAERQVFENILNVPASFSEFLIPLYQRAGGRVHLALIQARRSILDERIRIALFLDQLKDELRRISVRREALANMAGIWVETQGATLLGRSAEYTDAEVALEDAMGEEDTDTASGKITEARKILSEVEKALPAEGEPLALPGPSTTPEALKLLDSRLHGNDRILEPSFSEVDNDPALTALRIQVAGQIRGTLADLHAYLDAKLRDVDQLLSFP
ncbi:MAG: hypothetical protein HY586_03345, partial [Candidatus Omnitrophica bacterium]|nr:hypothetical protein [Candidatus Omnitrophota bacterium]